MRRQASIVLAVLAVAALRCGGPFVPAERQMTFPLEGSHAQLSCAQCHGETLGPLPTDCMDCHEPDRPADHFPGTDCVGCHPVTVWSDGVVDHSFFPLEQSHDLECTACHDAPPAYTGLDAACTSCHEAERPDDHFDDLDCGGCHPATVWADGVFDHAIFPLRNSHDLPCESCHTPGEPLGIDPACSSCHESDRPTNHFEGTDCGTCHRDTIWDDAEFDHNPWFPLPHRGVNACESCHLVADDYSRFECIECHEHRQSNTDGEHDDVRNYRYESAACYDCHPRGRE